LALTATAGERIVTLDVVRGVAVMGILAMNVVAFAMPFQAYMNPAAFGSEGAADYAAWALNFLLIDGKMRGLFSFLFGASMLLVIERAAAGGRDPGSVHFRRMAWLLLFGLLHFAFIWFGDILAGYALVGMIAYLFHRLTPRALVAWGVGLLVVQTLVFGAFALAALALQYAAADPGAASELAASWSQMQAQYGVPGQQALAADLALHHGGYLPLFLHRIDRLTEPFAGVLFFGWETLAYFLFGMALLKSGFFHGIWSRRQYVRVLLVGYGVGVPVMATIAYFFYQSGFSVPAMFGLALGATTPVRPLMILATASLIILRQAVAARSSIASPPQGARRSRTTSHVGADDDFLLRLWVRPVRLTRPGGAVDRGDRDLGADAALVQAVAAALPLRPARVGLALACPEPG
jgi:uncharacterized protein